MVVRTHRRRALLQGSLGPFLVLILNREEFDLDFFVGRSVNTEPPPRCAWDVLVGVVCPQLFLDAELQDRANL